MNRHGGPDSMGVPRWDFSTNANACGPEPRALQAVLAADPTRYPDPDHAHAVAMLQAWTGDATQRWVKDSLATLRAWKSQQIEACEPSDTPFYVARWDGVVDAPDKMLPRLRALGLKLRDATSVGLPGHVRVSVQPPEAQRALVRFWRQAAGQRAAAELSR